MEFDIQLHPHKDFPLLSVYKEIFEVTDTTIFAYDHKIYSNHPLPRHLIIHELTHHKQQDEHGLDIWVKKYLHDPKFRLKMEIEAYQVQLQSIGNPQEKAMVLMSSAKDLSGELYGNIISYKEALKAIK